MKSLANWTSIVTFPPPSVLRTATWWNTALHWRGSAWKNPRYESRKSKGTRAGNRAYMAQLACLNLAPASRAGSPHRLLGLHLRELHPHAALRAGLARALRQQGPGRDRRTHPGIHLRAV